MVRCGKARFQNNNYLKFVFVVFLGGIMLKTKNKRGELSFTIFILLIISINLVSAPACDSSGFMGSFQQDANVTITETCPTCTFINVSVKNTTSDFIITSQNMTLSEGTFSYLILGGNHSALGTYYVEGYSNLDNPFRACYSITNIQRETSTSESILYIALLVICILIFVFSLWGAIVLPFSNRKNAFERVIGITWAKYWKIGFITLTYLMFTWMMNLAVSITENTVSLTQFGGFFEMTFNILMALSYPFFITMFLFTNYVLIKDLKLNKLLLRGVNPR